MKGKHCAKLEFHGKWERGEVQVDGETIGYTLYEIDARTEDQRLENARCNALDGYLNVFAPGHGQTAAGARSLITTIVALSSSKILWSIDVDPPKGGDPTKAEALIKIIRRKASDELLEGESQESAELPFLRVRAFGWSHGAAELMRAAEKDCDLVQQVVGLCPIGLIERPPSELIWSFMLESLRILWDALRRRDWRTVARALAIGYDIISGCVFDFLRSKSLWRVIDDIRWASRKVPGGEYDYDGIVVILFGRKDTVIRWQDVFPKAKEPSDIEHLLEEYKRRNFPKARGLQVRVLEGNHIAAEANASYYIKTALDLLDQENDLPNTLNVLQNCLL